jgi:hypothetical protein
MDGRSIEPRKVMWAVAEVSWSDGNGAPVRAPATIEDMSVSGACLRLKAPVGVGSRLMVTWHREQFAAIARNCRSDGREFLLGVRRVLAGETQAAARNESGVRKTAAAAPQENQSASPSASAPQAASSWAQAPISATSAPLPKIPDSSENRRSRTPDFHSPSADRRPTETEEERSAFPAPNAGTSIAPARTPECSGVQGETASQAGIANRPAAEPQARKLPSPASPPHSQRSLQSECRSSAEERNPMQSKKLLPNFWRRPQAESAPEKSTEAAMSKPKDQAAEPASAPLSELLSYEDIYHAAGIMAPRSGYGIRKVVEMLNSDRIRDLSKEIKRASVLMALDAAGATVEELLRDARERKQALDAYEDRQRKQLEEFEARRAEENAGIQAEMERVTAHYAERIQRNRDLAAREKEALHNWQMAKQNESQRIDEVMELCAKQPAGPAAGAMAAAAGAPGGEAGSGATTRPTLVPEVSGRNPRG